MSIKKSWSGLQTGGEKDPFAAMSRLAKALNKMRVGAGEVLLIGPAKNPSGEISFSCLVFVDMDQLKSIEAIEKVVIN